MNKSNVVQLLTRQSLRRSFVFDVKFLGKRSFSTSAAAEATPITSIPLEKQQQPRPIFPWRHERKDIFLPRLTPGTKEYETIVAFPTPQEPFAFLFLGVPLWDAFLMGGWKRDLSENMTYAFLQGLAGIMSNVYRVPVGSSKVDDADAVKFSFPLHGASEDDDEDDDHAEKPLDIHQMLSSPLQKIFESAHESGRDQLRILLETKPVKSFFYRLYVVPFFTRDAVEADSNILKTLYNNGNPEWNTVFNMLQSHSVESLERYTFVETTVAAEVYIICEEKFQVVDAETGVVLQGPEGAPVTQEVGHMVTFEMTTKNRIDDHFPYFIRTEPGNWQIVDIDDLVSTKKWYHI